MVGRIRIGTGAGYSGDRIEPAVELGKMGHLDFLVFECLAERTIALAQRRKLADPNEGSDPMLLERMRRVLPYCIDNQTKIITNMGAANIAKAGEMLRGLIGELGLPTLRVCLVLGDDILGDLVNTDFEQFSEQDLTADVKENIISANAYLGASSILDALRKGADIIITGRTCDTSLFLAPMMHEFGWKETDWNRLGKGTAIAHLLECGAQVTGGYFADPGYKDVEGLANVGFPIAEIDENGEAVITKLPTTGGEVSLRTVKEQLLYEVNDPSAYITADVVAEFTTINVNEIERDRVQITGGGGKPRPEKLKVTIGYRNGYIGEAQIIYIGPGAGKRAELAAKTLMERFRLIGLEFESFLFDFMGTCSHMHESPENSDLRGVVLRVIGRANARENAAQLCNEVEALYVNGPAGGGGVRSNIEENIAIASAYIPRKLVKTNIEIMGADHD